MKRLLLLACLLCTTAISSDSESFDMDNIQERGHLSNDTETEQNTQNDEQSTEQDVNSEFVLDMQWIDQFGNALKSSLAQCNPNEQFVKYVKYICDNDESFGEYCKKCLNCNHCIQQYNDIKNCIMCIAINMGSAVGSNVEMMRCIKSIIELARAGVTDFVEFTNPFLRNLDQMQEEDVHNVAHTIYLRVLHLRRDSVNINKYGTKNCESNVLFQTKLWGLLEFVCSIHDYDDWRLNDALSTLDRAMQDEVNMWYCDIHFLLPLFVILSKFQDKLAEIQHEKVVCILLGVGYDLQKCELCDDKNKLTLLRNAVYHYVEKEDQCSLDCVLI